MEEDLDAVFNNASSFLKTLTATLPKEKLLQFYGLYKQATEGRCNKPKPSWYELTEKAKWEAWSSWEDLDSNTAKRTYISLLETIEPNWKEKPVESMNGWVKHSCMANNEEKIKDSNKTIFDWVKEKNLTQVKECGVNFDVNKLDENGLSLLHWASDRGSLDIVQYFVENLKADVNVKDSNGQTPLHYAVSCEYEDIEKYLIEAGADVNIRDDDGKTPYDE